MIEYIMIAIVVLWMVNIFYLNFTAATEVVIPHTYIKSNVSSWTLSPPVFSSHADIDQGLGVFSTLQGACRGCDELSNCVAVFSKDGAWIGHNGPIYQLASTISLQPIPTTTLVTMYKKS
jgi:hypothetical protein